MISGVDLNYSNLWIITLALSSAGVYFYIAEPHIGRFPTGVRLAGEYPGEKHPVYSIKGRAAYRKKNYIN